MVSLTFYGGVDEIGGNKILLEDGGTGFSLILVNLSTWDATILRVG